MSLDLDKRQRAMLREMGVRVWQPMPAPAADAINNAANNPLVQRADTGLDSKPPVAAAKMTMASTTAPPMAANPPQRRDASGVERMEWPALQAAVAGCTACALCQSRKNTVFGVGPQAPVDWLIVGEAPGENEDLAGQPFVGQAGKLLDNMLQAIGLQRGGDDAAPKASALTSIFITNVLKCRPPANRNPEPSEVAQCTPYLKRQVELLQPKMILALGKVAAQSLLQDTFPEVGKTPLGKLRGQVHSYLGVPVVVSYHPAYLLRSLSDKAKAWDDLCMAKASLNRQS